MVGISHFFLLHCELQPEEVPFGKKRFMSPRLQKLESLNDKCCMLLTFTFRLKRKQEGMQYAVLLSLETIHLFLEHQLSQLDMRKLMSFY